MGKRQGLPAGFVRLRAAKTSANYTAYSVTIPVWIGRKVGTEQIFEVVLNDDGILLRPVSDERADESLPAWVREAGGE